MQPRPGRRSAAIALALTGALALACGGPSVDPEVHMASVCSSSTTLTITGELVTLDAPVVELERGLQVTVEPTSLLVGFMEAGSAEEVGDLIRDEIQMAGMLTESTGAGATDFPIYVVVSPDVTSSRAWEVLKALHRAGATDLWVVGWSSERGAPIPYPDPAYGAELEAMLAGAAPAARQMLLAQELEGLITLCPGMRQAFEAVAYASPDMRCELMTYGMAEALPTCVATDGDKVITAVQVAMQPVGPLTAVPVKLDPGALPVGVGASSWARLGPALAERGGQRSWSVTLHKDPTGEE